MEQHGIVAVYNAPFNVKSGGGIPGDSDRDITEHTRNSGQTF